MKKEYLFLFAIIGIGILIRFVGIATNSFAFTYDVGRDMLALQKIVYLHQFPLIGFTTGMPGIFYGPWWYYLLAIPFAISSGNPQGVAAFMGIIGIATVILMYFVGKKIGDSYLGVTFALLTSFSPILVGLSSQIWNPNVAPFYLAISFLAIYRILKRPNAWMFFFLGILSGLLIDTEIVFGLLLTTSYIISLILLLRKKILTKQTLFAFLGLFVIFFPRIFFELRHHFLMTKTLVSMISHFGNIPTESPAPITNKIAIFLNQFAGTFAGNFHNLIYPVLILFIVMAVLLYSKAKAIEKQFLLFSLTVIITFIIGISLFKHGIWDHYLVGIPMFYILSVGILLNLLRKYIRYGSIISIVILLSLSWISLSPIQLVQQFRKPLFLGDPSTYRNQLAVIDYIYQRAHGQPFKEIVYTPPIFDYPYQYLFSWYGPRKYGYAPTTGQPNLIFLIIEPDTQHPSLLRDWLKIREHDGKMIEQHTEKDGVIIQVKERT